MIVSDLLLQRFAEYKHDTDDSGKPKLRSFSDKFKSQQRNIPKAHQFAVEIVCLSREGIEALTEDDDRKAFSACYEKSLELMCNLTLIDLDFEVGLKDKLRSHAGQEFAEMVLFGVFYNHVAHGEELPDSLPDPFDLYVPLPAYIAGLQDSVTELSRLTTVRRANFKLSLAEKVAMLERLRDLATKVRKTLSKAFSGVPQNIVNSSKGRVPHKFTFKGRLDGINHMVNDINKRLAEIIEDLQIRANADVA